MSELSSAAATLPPKTPIGVRIAGTLAGVVGVLTIAAAVAVGLPVLSETGSPLPLITGLLAGIGACVATALLWRRRRVGVLVLALSWAIPTFAALAVGESARGNLLLTAAFLLAAANWKKLY
jgi:hypothetical protein